MIKKNKSSGFTLIELLVVVSIISLLVAIIIPTISAVTIKANAATDAANLRMILGEANSRLIDSPSADAATEFAKIQKFDSKTIPDATAMIAYVNPGFMEAFFVDGSNYYSIEYFSEVADTGTSDKALASQPEGYTWYIVGIGSN